MNSRALILLFGLLLSISVVHANKPEKPKPSSLRVQVLDASSGEPLTGARISFANCPELILSDENGFFKLEFTENGSPNLITISLVSFQTISLPVSELSRGLQVLMQEK
jgi:hypothetical protein